MASFLLRLIASFRSDRFACATSAIRENGSSFPAARSQTIRKGERRALKRKRIDNKWRWKPRNADVWKKGHSVRSKDSKGAKPLFFPHTHTHIYTCLFPVVSDSNRQHHCPACPPTCRHPTVFSFGPRSRTPWKIISCEKWAAQCSTGCPPPSNFFFLSRRRPSATTLPVG